VANESGKWQLAFWIITGFCFTGFFVSGNAILAVNASVAANKEKSNQEFKEMRECIYNQLISINSRLAVVETLSKSSENQERRLNNLEKVMLKISSSKNVD